MVSRTLVFSYQVLTELINGTLLKSLDLSGNEISDAGGFHMANALLINHGLVMLNMNNNNMAEEACVKLLESIKVSCCNELRITIIFSSAYLVHVESYNTL